MPLTPAASSRNIRYDALDKICGTSLVTTTNRGRHHGLSRSPLPPRRRAHRHHRRAYRLAGDRRRHHHRMGDGEAAAGAGAQAGHGRAEDHGSARARSDEVSNCGARERCLGTVPNVKKLLDAARRRDMMLLYTLVGRTPTVQTMVDASLAPRAGEFVARGGADKFIGSDLEARLKEKGIKTVIVTGTSAQGAVVGTSNGAVQRGFKAVVPVDGMSAEDPYNEQYAAWHLFKGGPVNLTQNVILTRSDLIKFAN